MCGPTKGRTDRRTDAQKEKTNRQADGQAEKQTTC